MTHPQNSPHGATDTAPAQGRQTAIETVYEQLREGVISGAFEPGSRLNVDKLRQEYEVSTSTMREALSRLLVDALVISERQRGFRVAPLSLKDFHDITEARKNIESSALRASLENRTDDWEAQLVAAFHRLSVVEQRLVGEGRTEFAHEWDERNAHFHDCLVRNCNNAWLIRFRRTLHQHSYRYHRLLVRDRSLPRDVRAEHKAIFQAALDNDIDRCVALAVDHIDKSYESIVAQGRLH